MICPSCATENRPEARFCLGCGAALARTCPNGHPVVADARFCDECGAAVHGSSPAAAPAPTAERRLVSILFADLVGFTTASEGRDAEDTRELLTRYFDTSRTIIERYGGTVEKFIGDAVMAVWGAPTATEDDAERAVRAALDLVDSIPTLHPDLRARAGVLTGEAAVTLNATDQGMVAGDLVNTASRIQSAAQPGTVLVGDTTKRATEAAVVYADAGSHELKGKVDATQLWHATRIVAQRGGERRSATLEAPFVGRDRELRLVKELFHAAADEHRATLVTVVGVAGIGKSRLAWEFEKHIDGLVDDVYWHRGRCLSYGDGVAFWALAEMVRARAGIAEDEDESSALAKLRDTVARNIPDPSERAWVEPRLQQLLGLVERTGAEREDLFSAWRLFFERLSDHGAVALVFEDIHWADSGLIDFIDHLLEWSRSKPIFVLALARPEVSDRHAGFGARARNVATLMLDPLSDEVMEELLTGLVPGLPDDVRVAISERADGIPLYAVETVRMLLDRGLLARDGDTYTVEGDLAALAVPETLHALIAARLDGLEPHERALLEQAAVLGQTFAARGLAVLGGTSEQAVERILASLVRKEVLTLDADPRSPERGQYGFLQALVQRVAYDTLARRDRRALHLAAACYMADEAGIDPDEIAEVIAAHLRDADRADPDAPDAAAVRARAREWLVRAGERAAALAAPADALRAFDEAVLLADEPAERAQLLERAGNAAAVSNETELSVSRFQEARALFAAEGHTHDAARTTARMSLSLWVLGRSDDAARMVEEAFAVLASDVPDADVANLAAEAARIHFHRGDHELALERVDYALDVAEDERLPELLAESLNTKALLLSKHPHERLALHREALAIALEHDHAGAALRAYNNLAVGLTHFGRDDEAEQLVVEALGLARRRGLSHHAAFLAANRMGTLAETGDWDEAFALGEELLPPGPVAQGPPAFAVEYLAGLALERADPSAAAAFLDRVAPGVEKPSDQQQASLVAFRDLLRARLDGRIDDLLDHTETGVDLALAQGRRASAAAFLEESIPFLHDTESAARVRELVERLETASIASRPPSYERILALTHGSLASHAGDHDAAVEAFARALALARTGAKDYPLARVLAGYGTALVRAGRAEDAAPLLDEARQLFERMRATVWLERIEAVERAAGEEVRA